MHVSAKNQLVYGEYLTIIKKLKAKCSKGTTTALIES